MTTITATIEGLGCHAVLSTNPRYNPAFLSSGGILGWFGRTDVVRSMLARKADRDLRRAMDRLSKTSAHLLADVSRPDAAMPVKTEEMPRTVRPPVALRSAQRAAIASPRSAAMSATLMAHGPAATKQQPVAQ